VATHPEAFRRSDTDQLLPLYVRNQVYRALVETAAAFLGPQANRD